MKNAEKIRHSFFTKKEDYRNKKDTVSLDLWPDFSKEQTYMNSWTLVIFYNFYSLVLIGSECSAEFINFPYQNGGFWEAHKAMTNCVHTWLQ